MATHDVHDRRYRVTAGEQPMCLVASHSRPGHGLVREQLPILGVGSAVALGVGHRPSVIGIPWLANSAPTSARSPVNFLAWEPMRRARNRGSRQALDDFRKTAPPG
jgi:hypothetical protein